MWILILIIAAIIAWLIIRPYVVKHDTFCLYSGGPGSGKSVLTYVDACKCIKRLTFKVYWHNFLHPYDKWDLPKMFSNIPMRFKRFFWSKWEWANELKVEHLTMGLSLPLHSVVVVDEINLFLSQMDNKFESRKQLELFFTLFRHFTRGYFLTNTQNLSKVNCVIRYLLNESNNLFAFNKTPLVPLFAWTRCRTVTISEDVKVIEQGNKQDNCRFIFLFLFKYINGYDSYCYSDIYLPIPKGQWTTYSNYKIFRVLTLDTKFKYDDFHLVLN